MALHAAFFLNWTQKSPLGVKNEKNGASDPRGRKTKSKFSENFHLALPRFGFSGNLKAFLDHIFSKKNSQEVLKWCSRGQCFKIWHKCASFAS